MTGKCDFLHEHMIRAVHDRLVASSELREKTTIKEIQKSLVSNYDEGNHEKRGEVLWKQEALNAYPMKPTYQERKRFAGMEKRIRTNKNIKKYLDEEEKM